MSYRRSRSPGRSSSPRALCAITNTAQPMNSSSDSDMAVTVPPNQNNRFGVLVRQNVPFAAPPPPNGPPPNPPPPLPWPLPLVLSPGSSEQSFVPSTPSHLNELNIALMGSSPSGHPQLSTNLMGSSPSGHPQLQLSPQVLQPSDRVFGQPSNSFPSVAGQNAAAAQFVHSVRAVAVQAVAEAQVNADQRVSQAQLETECVFQELSSVRSEASHFAQNLYSQASSEVAMAKNETENVKHYAEAVLTNRIAVLSHTQQMAIDEASLARHKAEQDLGHLQTIALNNEAGFKVQVNQLSGTLNDLQNQIAVLTQNQHSSTATISSQNELILRLQNRTPRSVPLPLNSASPAATSSDYQAKDISFNSQNCAEFAMQHNVVSGTFGGSGGLGGQSVIHHHHEFSPEKEIVQAVSPKESVSRSN